MLLARFGSNFYLEGARLDSLSVARSGCWMLSWIRSGSSFFLEGVRLDEPQWGPFRLLRTTCPGSWMLLRAPFGSIVSFWGGPSFLVGFRRARSGRWMFWALATAGGRATGVMAPPLAREGGAIFSFGLTFGVKRKR